MCDEFVIVSDGRAKPFDGDLDDYMAWVSARRLGAGAAKDSENVATTESEGKQARAAAHAVREDKLARRRPLVKESEQLERKLARWHAEKLVLDAQLADAALTAADNGSLVDRLKRQLEVTRLIEEAEHRWLEVHMQIEEIGEI